MRSYRCLLACIVLLLCLHSVTAAPQSTLQRRQDESPSDRSQAPTASASIRPSATVTSDEDKPSSKVVSSRATSTTPASTDSADATTSMQVPATTASAVPQSTSSAAVDPKNPLPFQPSLTPAMGLSGVLLLLTGSAFAIIGIKNKWLYVFGSAAYLSALAVTVLIIYLMHPPVSNGVQGAFFVAAFFTGLIFGAVSLVFPDISEGFGCLLGGFCLSMWFLCLKSGGIIDSVTGRAIFIGCMSAGGYSLSFSHYTRTYGLIASTAFSGATATILGIDCLSCAGMKEFWLYLWALNDDVFPLETNTYPLTKNIKAELAGIVIITVLGVVSQLRVWKMVKDHREKSAAQELVKQQDLEREEEERGRKIEDSFQRERAQWEAAYGDKSIQDSSVASSILSPKHSTSVRENEVYSPDSVEMVNMQKSGVMRSQNPDDPVGSTVTVSVLEDNIQPIGAQGNPIIYTDVRSVPGSDGNDKDLPDVVHSDNVTKRTSLRPASIPPPPAVVPLSFQVPEEQDTESQEDDNASVSAVAETESGSLSGRKPLPKRISDMTNLRRASGQRNSHNISESQEYLISVPYVEADRASSIAATLDDEYDDISLQELSPPHSPIDTEPRVIRVSPPTVPEEDEDTTPEQGAQKSTASDAEMDATATEDTTTNEPTRPTVRQSLTSSTDPKPNATNKRASHRNSRLRVDTPVSNAKGNSEGQQSKSGSDKASSQTSEAEHEASHVRGLKESTLPPRLSKIALSYRTNEWAKHLETADLPELEELLDPSSPGAALDHGSEEKPAPVSDELAAPLISSRRVSRTVSAESRNATGSNVGLNRSTSTSQQSLAEQQAPSRSPPLLSPKVLSRSNSGTQLDALSPSPTNTLLDLRESLIRNRVSSHSFAALGSPGQTLLEQDEEDDMTLAQRRQLLKQAPTSPVLQHQPPVVSPRRPPPTTAQKWQKKGWAGQGVAPGFDSHQPQRTTNSVSNRKREDLYAGWRDSIQDTATPQTAAFIAEQQRAALLSDRRQKEQARQQREAVKQQRASMMDNMMRSGPMLEAHREAMRKMQANANRRAT